VPTPDIAASFGGIGALEDLVNIHNPACPRNCVTPEAFSVRIGGLRGIAREREDTWRLSSHLLRWLGAVQVRPRGARQNAELDDAPWRGRKARKIRIEPVAKSDRSQVCFGSKPRCGLERPRRNAGRKMFLLRRGKLTELWAFAAHFLPAGHRSLCRGNWKWRAPGAAGYFNFCRRPQPLQSSPRVGSVRHSLRLGTGPAHLNASAGLNRNTLFSCRALSSSVMQASRQAAAIARPSGLCFLFSSRCITTPCSIIMIG
jgi:hypothetical protein